MNELVAKIFKLYPFFCCIKNTYEDFVQREDVKKFMHSFNREIPRTITEIYETTCLIIKIIDVSLKVFPLGTSDYARDSIITVLKKTQWDKSFNNQVAREMHISDGSLMRFKKDGKKIVLGNMKAFFACQFNITNVEFDTSEENKIQKLINLSEFKDLFGDCDDLKKVANTAYNTFFYNKFFICYFKQLKQYYPNGRYYSTITKILIEYPEYESKKLLRNKFKYFSEKYTYRKVNLLVNESTDLLGVLLFGINYLAIDENIFLVKKP